MTANGRTILAFLLGAAIVFAGHALFRADEIVRARFAEPARACLPEIATPMPRSASPRIAPRAARLPIVIDGTAR